MRLAILGLSLLMVGCGGGGDDGGSQSEQPPIAPTPSNPIVWRPNTESPLNNADIVKSAIITTYQVIQTTIESSRVVFDKLPDNQFDNIPLSATTKNCGSNGTVTVELSKSGFDYHSKYSFGDCVESNPDSLRINGLFAGDAVIGTTFGSGSGKYQVNASISSTSGEKAYGKSRVIKHDVQSVIVNGVTDELTFDMEIAVESIDLMANTAGTAIIKTTAPIQFADSMQTSPIGGQVTIMNTKGRTWIAKVVPNGFDIYDLSLSNETPVDFLNWYSFNQ